MSFANNIAYDSWKRGYKFCHRQADNCWCRGLHVIIKIIREICVKLCLLLEMLITVKYMNIVHYYRDRACPTTNICTKHYSCDSWKVLFMLYFLNGAKSTRCQDWARSGSEIQLKHLPIWFHRWDFQNGTSMIKSHTAQAPCLIALVSAATSRRLGKSS